MTQNRLPVIGITGNTGVGKTTICGVLAELGAYVLNADALAHAVMQPGEAAYNAIIAAFGETMAGADGGIDRKALGAVVFADRAKRRLLESIIHPRVCERIFETINRLQASPGAYRYIVIDAPLLVEADLHLSCDSVWLVTATEAEKTERIIQRDGLSPEAAALRMMAQRDENTLRPYAHVVIDNSGGLPRLTEQIYQALQTAALSITALHTVALQTAREANGV